jgi:hypothetical protein
LQPELTITDPVQLERRLKRQRSDGAATDSHGSDEDAEGRDAKRSRMAAAAAAEALDDGGPDPLNLRSPDMPRQTAVRFANNLMPLEPMQPLDHHHQPNFNPNVIDPALYATSFNAYPSDAMAVDSPPRQPAAGFDPALLNPIPPMDDPFFAIAGPSTGPQLSDPANAGTGIPIHSLLQSTESAAPPPPTRSPSQRPKSLDPEPEPVPPIPMVVERTPTPPLPDFEIDDALVAELEATLCDSTSALTIEQLEQLRATCLATVWRHRTEWDRTPAVRELHELVKEFVDQVGGEESDADM